MTSNYIIPSSFLLTLKTGSHQPKLKKKKKTGKNLFFHSIFKQSLQRWQNDQSMKENDLLVMSPCNNVALGKCLVTKFPKINIELRRRGIRYFVTFLLFSKYLWQGLQNLHASKETLFIELSRNARKNCCFEISENSQKNVISRVYFKQFYLYNLPSITLLKTDSFANEYFLLVLCEFLKLLEIAVLAALSKILSLVFVCFEQQLYQ